MTLVIPSAIKYLISKQVFKAVTGKSEFTLSKMIHAAYQRCLVLIKGLQTKRVIRNLPHS